jgi:hypothetical protein
MSEYTIIFGYAAKAGNEPSLYTLQMIIIMNKVWRIANGVFEKCLSVTYTSTVLVKMW